MVYKLEDNQGVYATYNARNGKGWHYESEEEERKNVYTSQEMFEKLQSYSWGKQNESYMKMLKAVKAFLGLIH